MLRSPGSPKGMPVLHTGPATLTLSCRTMIKVLVLFFSKAVAHTRFLNENSCWLRLLVPLVSLEMFFQERNVH